MVQDRFRDKPERYNRLLKMFSDFYANDAPDGPRKARVLKIRAEMRDIL